MIDYYAGMLIDKHEGAKRKLFLIVSLVANIGVLVVFKYYNFFIDNFNLLLPDGRGLNVMSILLPVGLSFHTFQAMSYTIEIYRKKYSSETHFGYYALYVMYFPQLVAGPIERPQNVIHQLKEKKIFNYDGFSTGIRLIIYGLFKKVVIADNISTIVNDYYGEPSSTNSILAVLCFSIQIYCDFSGYTDIARGSSRLMGIDLMKNFNFPYFATSISEFWKRWHISLSTWFRDFLYIPLGGNRVSQFRQNFNIFIVFGISGFWHGANWTFIIWGTIYALLLISENYLFKINNRFFASLVTFSLVSILWILFRSSDFQTAYLVFRNLFSNNFQAINLSAFSLFYIVLTGLFMTFEYHIRNKGFVNFVSQYSSLKRKLILIGMIYAILFLGSFEKNQFIYFQF